MKKDEKNYFEVLNDINVNSKVEKKNNLSYLSWAWAWSEVKKKFPKSNYKIYETETGVNYWNDGNTAWVKTGVIVEDIEHIEYLPVMDFRNKSITIDKITSFDVNKAIQRSLTKALARHGLGLYIYAGEDLPENESEEQKEVAKPASKPKKEKEEKTGIEDSKLETLTKLIKDKNKSAIENLVSSRFLTKKQRDLLANVIDKSILDKVEVR